uniref:BHLH domain-containing protein n=1 Tax=Daucus carota subsp. sativus TaxID=79200 RepID=A0A161WXN2_DAUCS
MGYLLKEALKTLCGVNQWSYAVFWKIGCQNPKLLIWEESYYGPITYSGVPPMPDLVSPEACNSLGFQGGDRVQLLVNKMMLDNYVYVVGEGLVGRAAFTGNSHWILTHNYTKEYYPPETVAVIPVLPHGVVQLGSSSSIIENMQFVDDVKTLILQLGYVPGSLFSDNLASKEPSSEIGALMIENPASMSSTGKCNFTDLTSYTTNNYGQQNDSLAQMLGGQTSNLARQIQDDRQSSGPNFQNCHLFVSNNHSQAQVIPNIKTTADHKNQTENEISKAEIVTADSKLWQNEEASFHIPRSIMNQQSSLGPSAIVPGNRIVEKKMLVNAAVGNGGLNESDAFLSKWVIAGLNSNHTGSSSAPPHKPINPHNALGSLPETANVSSVLSVNGMAKRHNLPVLSSESEFQNGSQYSTELSTLSFATNSNSAVNLLPASITNKKNEIQDITCTQGDSYRDKEGVKNIKFQQRNVPFPSSENHSNMSSHSSGFIHDTQKQNSGYQDIAHAQYEDAYAQTQSGNDLFDVFGMNFKNSLFDESWKGFVHDGPGPDSNYLDKNTNTLYKIQNASSELQVVSEENSDSGVLCRTGTDHLLDAVVCRVQAGTKQVSDENLSCRASLEKISGPIAATASTSSRLANNSNQVQEACSNPAKSLPEEGALKSYSFNYKPCKEEPGKFSQTTSFYGSQSSSWVEQGPEIKQSSSTTTFSKRSDEISKSNRKRLKPGENPRPRPKDRQMIQDRVKELREIVPNSSKCSIDALLERTIKHMLFLQSVTKHADKLKQTGESMIINKEGGLLLKDNFDGGATWAYEVGSQSMVCPIIVEDLSPPRQMLVEMLCEERGLFLEIADIVRGLGLTILKGIMETRNDKIWARFAVEANRDVTRMEIFLSLVRLLEQSVESKAEPANCVGGIDGAMSHQAFHPGVSIAATGRPCNFQ